MNAPTPTVLVLASGRGTRFAAAGGQGSKLHAMLAGRRVLQRTLDAVRASGLAWHLEDQGHDGMGDSIAAAVRATAGASGWLVLPGDLPLIAPESLRAVAAALDTHEVVLPHYRQVRGHPVGFGRARLVDLTQLGGQEGAARVVRKYASAGRAVKVELDDAGIVTDIDTPDDLLRAERMLRGT